MTTLLSPTLQSRPPPSTAARRRTAFRPSCQGDSVCGNLLCNLVQGSKGIWKPVVDWIRRTIGNSIVEVVFLRKIGIVGAGREGAKATSTLQSTTQLSTKLKMKRNHSPKAAKEQTNYGSTIAKIHEHCNNFALLKSVNSSLQTGINQRSRENELSATNLAPKGGVKRRQSTEIGFG
ncbi:hypothetical protein F511_28614 [Dorcoceras hygrometricum]|uniref:Uncharacterized protein n=1 Tax=Dorcoceras hygrometricum TaxID=472368 RepID=A0A2Z7AFV7_9LAMI|nr:hypothetical protein F511_28614 [Dorcoceras hygrometricum]